MREIDSKKVDRRTTLQWISTAAASCAIPGSVVPGSAASPSGSGYGPDPDLLKNYQPGDLWPLTFTGAQRKLITVLCDIIVPADETSPSASQVGVPAFVDEWISSPYPGQKSDRDQVLKGLEWLDQEAGRRGGDNFVSLSSEGQYDICHELSVSAKKNRGRFPGSFFYRLRNLVAGGYYTTPEGMRDIGYRGNVAMLEWNGPTREALDHLGLEPQDW